MELVAHKRGLTERNKAFADAYAGDHKEAAKAVDMSEGYARQLIMSTTAPSVRPAAIAVQERIRERERTEVRPNVLTRIERQELWSKWTKGVETPTPEQLRASELLGKSELDFGERRVNTELTLADIAARAGVETKELPENTTNEQDTSTESQGVQAEKA